MPRLFEDRRRISTMASDGPADGDGFLDSVLGIDYVRLDEDVATAQVPVGAQLKGARGTVHGGVYSAIAESLASMATAKAVMSGDLIAMGMTNDTDVLADVADGVLQVTAHRRYRDETRWVWDVEVRADGGLCSMSRVTVAVRSKPPRIDTTPV
jgi:1,4-dihydroxy-2-naphthoyl-CoA hydrolase